MKRILSIIILLLTLTSCASNYPDHESGQATRDRDLLAAELEATPTDYGRNRDRDQSGYWTTVYSECGTGALFKAVYETRTNGSKNLVLVHGTDRVNANKEAVDFYLCERGPSNPNVDD